MLRWLGRGAGALSAASLLAACGGATAPASSQASAAASKPAPAAGSSAAAATASKPSAAAASGQAVGDWDQVIGAAKKEGKVVVYGPVGAGVQTSLTDGFKKAYPDIQVEYTGAARPDMVSRLLNERAAGQFLPDVLMSATTTFFIDLKPAGAYGKILPYLVGPESKDPSKWRDGKLYFDDNAQDSVLGIVSFVTTPFAYNPKLVNPTDIKSYKDLLDPRWKGKLAMKSPKLAGTGQSLSAIWYADPTLGEDFLKSLIPAVTMSEDDTQMINWVVNGDYPIGIGLAASGTFAAEQKGVQIKMVHGSDVKEGTWQAEGGSPVAVADKAPHPNATKVYLDWLLSQPAQQAYTDASGQPSRRTDVSTAHTNPAIIPRPGVQYQDLDVEKNLELSKKAIAFVTSLMK